MTEIETYEAIAKMGVGRTNISNEKHYIAIAVKKQIPKKIIRTSFINPDWLCPSCNAKQEIMEIDTCYCPYCGQRIDWSDEDED